MIAYFDTSGVVPLLVAETGSARAAILWNEADRAVSIRLVYPEGRASFGAPGRIRTSALQSLEPRWYERRKKPTPSKSFRTV